MQNRRAQNHLPVNTVVIAVAFNTTIGLIGLLLLSYYNIQVNDAVVAIVGGMAGSLSTLLTTTRGDGALGTPAEPVQAEIVNTDTNAVPVTPTPEAPTTEPAGDFDGVPAAVIDDGGDDLTSDTTAVKA